MDRQTDLIKASWILPLEACNERSPVLVGRKAATLAAVAVGGYVTPGGQVLTSDAFWDALSACGVAEQVRYLGEAALRLDPAHVLALGRAINDGLATAVLEEKAAQAAAAVWPNIGSARFVCRSSAAMEDGRDAAFPGMFLSVLDLTSTDELRQAVAACWRSVFTPTMLRYLLRVRPAAVDFSTALIVQPQVQAAWYGLSFSSDPRTHDGDMIAELSDAGPEALVGGAAAKARFTFRDGGWRGDVVPPPGLDAVATFTRRMAQAMQCPVDIEFALSGGDAVPIVLQCRPVTRAAAPFDETKSVTVTERRRGTPCAPGRAAGSAGGAVLAVEQIGIDGFSAILDASALAVGVDVSPLSHIANLCRELGVPFVSGLHKLDDLGTRQLLVDGTAGELLILAAEVDGQLTSSSPSPLDQTAAALGATELIAALIARGEAGDDVERLLADVLSAYRRRLGVERTVVSGDVARQLGPLLAELFGVNSANRVLASVHRLQAVQGPDVDG